jgi:hypothetical protein
LAQHGYGGWHEGAAGIVAIIVLGVALASCTVSSTHSTRVADGVKVSAVRVLFDPRPPPTARVTTTATGPGAAAIVGSLNELDKRTALQASQQFQQVFTAGFRDRFPALAAKYGLTVAPDADVQLGFRIVEQSTSCAGKCVTKVTMGALLLDASRKPLWRFDTRVGQATVFASISNEMFDALAEEVLQAMKKDGIIGQ